MRSKTIIAALLATVALAVPTTSNAEERDHATEERRGPNKPMLITGSAIFLGAYTGSVIGGAISDNEAEKNLFIPVVGPWMSLAQRECSFGECSRGDDFVITQVIGAGAAQAAGLGILVASFFVGERPEKKPAATGNVQILPLGLRAGGGIGAVGTF